MNTVIITGATSGIGFAVSKALTRLHYKVIGIGHSERNCDIAKKQILLENPDADISFFYADLMQQREVNRIAGILEAFLEENCDSGLYALINNAGCVRSWYTTTEEGYEQQFALNHLSGFLLTHRLLPYLKRASGRVMMTSSESHKRMKIHWKDIMYQKGYNPLLAYKQSKLCNLLFAYALNSRYCSEGIRAYGIDPGLVRTDIGNKRTGGLVNFVWNLRKSHGVSPDTPAKTYAYLCDQIEKPQGLYYHQCRETTYSRQVNAENAERLFALSENYCGITYGQGI
ncbi:MAG: SDR family NAD(P)-dependent oxidoreductase [Flexilinea sp.]